MSSTGVVLRGDQRPLAQLLPRSVDSSDAEDAIALGSAYGLIPDPWQEHVLRSWLARRPDKRWAASRAGLSVPRQNGKNAVVEVRELFGIVVLGEKWLHTAHEVKTARKAFLRLSSFFENPRKYPELAALLADIRKTNGQEAIVLANGGSVEFIARSKSSGRGFTVDGLLFDEAQELTDESLEALIPTTSAGPLANPQHIYTGTPPGPKANGEVFTRLHSDGHAGKERRLSWIEHGAPKPCDLDDPEMWARANPGQGYRIGLDEMANERATFDDQGFGRERLGWWDDAVKGDSGITAEMWTACGDPSAKMIDQPVLALDVSPNRWTAIALAGHTDAGMPLVEVPDFRMGTDWVVDRIVGLCETWGITSVSLDPTGPVGALIPFLQAAGIEPALLTFRDMAQACGILFNAVSDTQLRHLGNDDWLNLAVAGASRRPLGDAWAWTRRSSQVDIAPLVASTIALRAVSLAAPVEVDVSLNVW
jgi:hypothetical protein